MRIFKIWLLNSPKTIRIFKSTIRKTLAIFSFLEFHAYNWLCQCKLLKFPSVVKTITLCSFFKSVRKEEHSSNHEWCPAIRLQSGETWGDFGRLCALHVTAL